MESIVAGYENETSLTINNEGNYEYSSCTCGFHNSMEPCGHVWQLAKYVIDNDLEAPYEYEKNEDKEENYYSMAGRIHISDMLINTDVDSIKRDGIKIDRETGATETGAKFDYNVIPLGAYFKFEMELDNVEGYQLDLIKLALKDILEEDLFGGKLSRGIGKCKLNIEKIEFVDKTNIQDYLFKKSMKTKDVKEFLEITNLELK